MHFPNGTAPAATAGASVTEPFVRRPDPNPKWPLAPTASVGIYSMPRPISAPKSKATPSCNPKRARPNGNPPIQSVTITNGDLDHVVGLLFLRELQKLHVHCATPISQLLRERNDFYWMLQQFPEQTQWAELVPEQAFVLPNIDGSASGLRVHPIALSSTFPRYLPAELTRDWTNRYPKQAVFGLVIQDERTPGQAGLFPGRRRVDG